MKKKLFMLVIVGFLMMGTVNAASMWGTYRGNDIIRLTVDGVPVRVTDVPAFNYDNRTMLPIYLLKQAGLSYTWDQKNKTVNIHKPFIPDAVETRKAPISWLKLYTEGLHIYSSLMVHGRDLTIFHRFIFTSMDYSINDSSLSFTKDADSTFSHIQSTLLDTTEYAETVVENLTLNKINHNIVDIIDLLAKSLESYYDALESVKSYNSSKLQKDFDSYRKNLETGDNYRYQAEQKAVAGYDRFLTMIRNYE